MTILCNAAANVAGYLNSTCDAGTTSATPLLLTHSEEKNRFAEWRMTVVGQSPEGDDLVTIRASYPTRRGTP